MGVWVSFGLSRKVAVMQRVKKLPAVGGKWVKAADLASAHGLLIVPVDVKYEVESQYGPQNVVVADIWVFRSAADVDAGTPEELVAVSWAVNKGIARQLDGQIGNLVGPVVVSQDQSKRGNGRSAPWELVDLSPAASDYAGIDRFADGLAAGQSDVPPMPSF